MTTRTTPARQPFDLLLKLAGDPEMARIFGPDATIESWVRVEAALAAAQADAGVVPRAAAEAIEQTTGEAVRSGGLDRERLWAEARNVGYPILPLVRQLDELLPEQHRGHLHFGATTQDIMDSGLALQLVAGSDLLLRRLDELGDLVAAMAIEHRRTVMPARTHAQQAVPTTWGAKLGGYLGELTRHHHRLNEAREGVRYVSLFGAGGTSAAYGPSIGNVREGVAARLGLRPAVVSHHVARDCLAQWGLQAAALCATGARLAREVIDLSRNEIAELSEQAGHLRGASSTMPQKANPISSEVLVGLAATAGALASGLLRTMEAGHDRAAGEWQAEWQLLPLIAAQASAALVTAVDLVANLQVFPATMRANLTVDHGLVMAEAYMIGLAETLGRERAHELVYAAARNARAKGVSLFDAVRAELPDELTGSLTEPLAPENYLGEVDRLVDVAAEDWRNASADRS